MVITTSPHLADKSVDNIKFLCSYGGKIVPRFPDAKLRYHGGHTRVLSLNRHTSFPELLLKMAELCDSPVNLRCQLPNEDLDALVTIKSDEDLVNLIEEYDQIAPSSMKIRAFLSPLKTTTTSKTPSPPSSEYATSSLSPKSLSPPSSFYGAGSSPRFLPVSYGKRSPVVGRNVPQPKSHYGCHHCHRTPSHMYLVHNGNHWQ